MFKSLPNFDMSMPLLPLVLFCSGAVVLVTVLCLSLRKKKPAVSVTMPAEGEYLKDLDVRKEQLMSMYRDFHAKLLKLSSEVASGVGEDKAVLKDMYKNSLDEQNEVFLQKLAADLDSLRDFSYKALNNTVEKVVKELESTTTVINNDLIASYRNGVQDLKTYSVQEKNKVDDELKAFKAEELAKMRQSVVETYVSVFQNMLNKDLDAGVRERVLLEILNEELNKRFV